jgi:hypothetical protein
MSHTDYYVCGSFFGGHGFFWGGTERISDAFSGAVSKS